jgi:hypothetical protein
VARDIGDMAAQRRVAVVARHLADAVDEEPPRVAGGPNAGVWERRDPSENAMANVDVNRQGPLHVKIRASECMRNSHACSTESWGMYPVRVRA